jgi:hypothetical protein
MSDANSDNTDKPHVSITAIDMSPEAVQARLQYVWKLTIDEWAKKGIDITRQPMQKDVVRLTELREH